MSCLVLHNYCRDRNLEYNVEDDVKEMLRKESVVILTRKHQENTSEEEALKLRQLARDAITGRGEVDTNWDGHHGP